MPERHQAAENTAPPSPSVLALHGVSADTASFWQSLKYFHLYRIVVASLFVIAALFPSWSLPFGSDNVVLTRWVSHLYLLLAVLVPVAVRYWKASFDQLLTAEVIVDIAALTLLMSASGGSRSGLSYLLLVVLAAAGLLGQGRLTLFYAAVATLGVFLEQGHRILRGDGEAAEFSYAGIVGIGFFATAVTARLLARRVVANEALARKRGVELSQQLDINRRVIRDMHEGVLVADVNGKVSQYNPRAASLWDCAPGQSPHLEAFSPLLAQRYLRWQNALMEVLEVMRSPRTGKLLRVRYVPAAGSANALLYVEDLEEVEAQARAQAQQIKLMALGRLTANMAHEIRNPLAAINHAAELLRESREAGTHERLTRIIGDNAQRLNRLVTDVMELSRRDRVQPEVIRLNEAVAGLIADLALTNPGARTWLAVDIPAGLRVVFDRSHLHRVLSNLIENALHFSSQGTGSVNVRAGVDPSTGGTVLDVEDDGPGVGPDLREKLFEPFFTTRRGGTGLGLYIARELCQANDASLELATSVNGACFRIVGRGEQ